jgi:Zn-dependent metalloprotease
MHKQSSKMFCQKSTVASPGCACCFIIPPKVLERFSHDKKVSAEARKACGDAALFEKEWRKLRTVKCRLTLKAAALLPQRLTVAPAGPPAIPVFDCHNGTVLPGNPVSNPGSSPDATAKRAFVETTAVAKFYKEVFGRNSIDNTGMAMVSSIHYSVNYNNAFWNGTQMTYGDGDGSIFVDFTKSDDVIGHELTHGVTQHTLGLSYVNQAGGLNESISDVFGSMFRQWEANQTVKQADWLIGKEIMGPAALAQGYTCLRDLSNPAAKHCLSPQPTKFSQYKDGMDPHESSGIPNFAFYKAAIAIGGKSWETAGKIWYEALTGSKPSPNMKMAAFAKRTSVLAGSLFSSQPTVKAAIDKAWKEVGIKV